MEWIRKEKKKVHLKKKVDNRTNSHPSRMMIHPQYQLHKFIPFLDCEPGDMHPDSQRVGFYHHAIQLSGIGYM